MGEDGFRAGLRGDLATMHGNANRLLATRLDAILTSELTSGATRRGPSAKSSSGSQRRSSIDAKCSSSGTIRRKMPPASRQRGLSRTPRPVSTDVYISVTACRQIGDGGHTVSVGYAVLVSACVFAEYRVQSVDVAK